VQQPDTQSFVIKVWLEETVEEAGRARWRGHVTHVASGERRYVESVAGLTAFIRPYLERWGVKFSFSHRVRNFVIEKWGSARRRGSRLESSE